MKTLFSLPRPLIKKILGTVLIGFGCFILGLAFWLSAGDRVLFLLSLMILLASFAKGINYYMLCVRGKYQVVAGTCIAVAQKVVGKYQTVTMLGQDTIESKIRVNKHCKFKIGEDYRLYFTLREHNKIGNEYLESVLAADSFLGYEAIEPAPPEDTTTE